MVLWQPPQNHGTAQEKDNGDGPRQARARAKHLARKKAKDVMHDLLTSLTVQRVCAIFPEKKNDSTKTKNDSGGAG